MDDVYLPIETQKSLIDLSRRALENFVRGTRPPAPAHHDAYLDKREYGAFVSLHKEQQLRGCIGNCEPRTPLFQTVIRMTEAAASQDHRVDPIAAAELGEVRIELTILSPLAPVSDALALEPGRHGLHVSRRGRRGVLLPQVATRYGWDIKTFLEQTCMKAGLPAGAWSDSATRIMAFTALIIEEGL